MCGNAVTAFLKNKNSRNRRYSILKKKKIAGPTAQRRVKSPLPHSSYLRYEYLVSSIRSWEGPPPVDSVLVHPRSPTKSRYSVFDGFWAPRNSSQKSTKKSIDFWCDLAPKIHPKNHQKSMQKNNQKINRFFHRTLEPKLIQNPPQKPPKNHWFF